jgi:hypothetical protein
MTGRSIADDQQRVDDGFGCEVALSLSQTIAVQQYGCTDRLRSE